MHIIVFEDTKVSRLYPATIGKPAFAISCAGYRLIELLLRLTPHVAPLVRPYLTASVRADFPDLLPLDTPRSGSVLLVNARLTPHVASLRKIEEVLAKERPGVARVDDSIAMALLPADHPLPSRITGCSQLLGMVEDLGLPRLEMELPLFVWPHDLVRHHLAIFRDNLADRLTRGQYEQIERGVFAAEGACLGSFVVVDSRGGPIVLERNASIGPYTYLSGPAVIGENARVIEHSAIKDCVALGHTTKVGGEVEGSTVEPYTNKQHHGFLGHSYLGSWVNLGAGTCNSDLKNTYGHVTMEYDGKKVNTGMQFVGCIVGDYAKTAINTSIFTGKTIGACSMVYGFVTTNVPSFVNYARSFGQVTEAPVEVMISTQERMFIRRNVEQRPCDVQLLRDMYELTRHERQLANEPLSL